MRFEEVYSKPITIITQRTCKYDTQIPESVMEYIHSRVTS